MHYIYEISIKIEGGSSLQDIAKLFQTYKNDVYRLAYSYLGNIQEAEDVCQTVFLKLLQHSHLQPGKEKSWLLKVTANECKMVLRSFRWKRTSPLEEANHTKPPQADHVLPSVMMLEPKYRTVVYLHYYEGYSTKEIGHILKISQSAVTTRLSRARQMLKNYITEE